ncbi:hypothetical protein [Paenibacillus sp. Soil787]|uniref:hypothetical protein n=1 Tax=Paenibacillus sp. Soil787 TaxID=1736411 RepID=UPI0007024801|nr:hypothetical protein [Paenibacillus sp. Soil787]KRF18407.1 hypothetical protein ASG93_10110 [Paenibacillus sp. Soil787]
MYTFGFRNLNSTVPLNPTGSIRNNVFPDFVSGQFPPDTVTSSEPSTPNTFAAIDGSPINGWPFPSPNSIYRLDFANYPIQVSKLYFIIVSMAPFATQLSCLIEGQSNNLWKNIGQFPITDFPNGPLSNLPVDVIPGEYQALRFSFAVFNNVQPALMEVKYS